MEAEGVSVGPTNCVKVSKTEYCFPASKQTGGMTTALRAFAGNWVHNRSSSCFQSAQGPLGSTGSWRSITICTSFHVPG